MVAHIYGKAKSFGHDNPLNINNYTLLHLRQYKNFSSN